MNLFLLSDLAKSKGLEHLLAPEKQAKLETDAEGDGNCATEEKTDSTPPAPIKEVRSSRQVLRECLDGIVEPDILDSCVDDLQLITAHSGNQLCHLVKVTHSARDAQEAAAANAAELAFATELSLSGDSKEFYGPKSIPDGNLKIIPV